MTTRIPVFVYADDPISQAGIASQLRPRPEIVVIDDNVDAAAVAVVAAPLDTPIAGGVARSHDPPGFVSLRLFAILCTLIL